MFLKKKDYEALVQKVADLEKRVKALEEKPSEQRKEKEPERPFSELKKDWMLFEDEKKGSGV